MARRDAPALRDPAPDDVDLRRLGAADRRQRAGEIVSARSGVADRGPLTTRRSIVSGQENAMKMRTFLLATLSLVLAVVAGRAQPPQVQPSAQEGLDRMGVVGYADRLSAQPGDTIAFMVSSAAPRYRADIVRIIHGDINPKGPGMKETVVDTPVNREYAGARQGLPLGSHISVADNAALRLAGSMTLTAWIASTRHDPMAPGGRAPDGDQGIVAKWSSDGTGYGLVVENDGTLALWLGASEGRTEKIRAQTPLRGWVPSIPGAANAPRPQHVTTTAWYFVAAAFDAATGRVTLTQEPLTDFTFDPTRATLEQPTRIKAVATNTAPLLIAALGANGSTIAGHFNGKIESPRVYGRALTRAELDAIRQGRGPADA